VSIKNQTSKKFGLPKLLPKLDAYNLELINQSKLLFELMNGFGSPLSLLFPDKVVENLSAFEAIFSKHFLQGRVYFAHKANRSSAFIKKLAITNTAHIDVASEGELQHALGCGFPGKRIGATGPKNKSFLRLAIQHDVLISIDSHAELDSCIILCDLLKKKAKITIRLSEIQATNTIKKTSRFGVPISSLDSIFLQLKKQSYIELVGFAFHLSSTSLKERATSITLALQMLEKAKIFGFNPTILNIGGGYKTNYIESRSDWDTFITNLKESVLGSREAITLDNFGYGLYAEAGTLKGSLNVYSFYDEVTGPDYLDAVLSFIPDSQESTVAELLSDSLVELMIEPGRSLTDLSGITLTKVLHIKKTKSGEMLIVLDSNKSDQSFLDHDYCVDPILIKKTENNQRINGDAFLVGNLCLESDFIMNRKINFPELPEPGDMLAFINTAGYYSDFSSNQALMQPEAQKIAVYKNRKTFCWTTDERYEPLCSITQ